MKSVPRYLPLLLLPILLLVFAILMNNVKGPYWLGHNSDPEYSYLLNSLNLSLSKKIKMITWSNPDLGFNPKDQHHRPLIMK